MFSNRTLHNFLETLPKYIEYFSVHYLRESIMNQENNYSLKSAVSAKTTENFQNYLGGGIIC